MFAALLETSIVWQAAQFKTDRNDPDEDGSDRTVSGTRSGYFCRQATERTETLQAHEHPARLLWKEGGIRTAGRAETSLPSGGGPEVYIFNKKEIICIYFNKSFGITDIVRAEAITAQASGWALG